MSTKLIEAFKTIAAYLKANKPKTMAEAVHKLDVVEVIATEVLAEVEGEKAKAA